MRKVLSAVVIALVALAACGSDESPRSAVDRSPAAGVFPVTLKAANGDVRVERRPQRIVSLSPTATEMLFAVEAGAQVIAVDDQSNYPPQAPKTSLSGFQPNVEAIAAQRPDLVVISNDPGDLAKALGALQIPVLLQPAAATLDDTYVQIEQLGVATGHVADAAGVVAEMKKDIEGIVSSVRAPKPGPTYYHELDDTYFSVTSSTFIGQVYSLFGLRNIADAAPDTAGGYPQLSAELIVSANPDVIFLADAQCCGVTAQTLAKRPGWDTIAAVREGRVVALDGDIASRWGPRIVQLVRVVAGVVEKLEPVER